MWPGCQDVPVVGKRKGVARRARADADGGMDEAKPAGYRSWLALESQGRRCGEDESWTRRKARRRGDDLDHNLSLSLLRYSSGRLPHAVILN